LSVFIFKLIFLKTQISFKIISQFILNNLN